MLVLRFLDGDQKASTLKRSSGIFDHAAGEGHWFPEPVKRTMVYLHFPAQIESQKFSRLSPSPGNLHERPVTDTECWSVILACERRSRPHRGAWNGCKETARDRTSTAERQPWMTEPASFQCSHLALYQLILHLDASFRVDGSEADLKQAFSLHLPGSTKMCPRAAV